MDRRFSILVVDDEPVNIQLVSTALKDQYDILSAMNGHDAITLLKETVPDLIILDVMMPDIDGFDVCKVIKANPLFADIPVIFMTAMDTHEGALQGLGLGGIDYLAKPVKVDLLELRVRNHIESKKRTDVIKEQRDMLALQKAELQAALERVKQLEGLIPICAYCKKIRDSNQSWHELEAYISAHSEALFTHGICPDCIEEQLN